MVRQASQMACLLFFCHLLVCKEYPFFLTSQYDKMDMVWIVGIASSFRNAGCFFYVLTALGGTSMRDRINGKAREGWIEVICGGMFSGKSEELIRRIRRAKIA